MKIRIQGNSIRYRLKEPEVANFKMHGSVTETIQLGTDESGQLSFMLRVATGDKLTVQHTAGTTIIKVPEQIAREWTGTNLVGFDGEIELGNGKTLKVLVEKDFKCLDGNEKENEGAYPNPMQQC